jgi:hypothetical protein
MGLLWQEISHIRSLSKGSYIVADAVTNFIEEGNGLKKMKWVEFKPFGLVIIFG